jgi:hypothetical protein
MTIIITTPSIRHCHRHLTTAATATPLPQPSISAREIKLLPKRDGCLVKKLRKQDFDVLLFKLTASAPVALELYILKYWSDILLGRPLALAERFVFMKEESLADLTRREN